MILEKTETEGTYIEDEIRQLNLTDVTISRRIFIVTHELQFIMHDGKIAHAVTITSSLSKRYICKAAPRAMNNI